MKIRIRKTGRATILDLNGPLTLGKGDRTLRESVAKLREAGAKNLAINLAGVTKLDSSGIGVLVQAFTSMKKLSGHCQFYAAPKTVRQLLKMVALDTVFDLVEDEASALAKF